MSSGLGSLRTTESRKTERAGKREASTKMASKSKTSKNLCVFSFACGLLVIATIIAVLATVCTVAAVVIHQSTLATSNYKIEVAKRRIVQLERMINDSTNTLRSSAQQQASNVHTQIDQLNSTHQTISSTSNDKFSTLTTHHSANYNELNQDLQQVQASFPSRMESAVGDIESGVKIRSMNIETLNIEMDELKEREVVLDMRVNSNASFYSNCTLQTEKCFMEDTLVSGLYWKTCTTNSTAMNVEGFYTVNMKCDYATSHDTDLQEAVLRYDKYTSTSYCQCSVAIPDNTRKTENTEFTFRPLPTDLTGICTMYVTRCPGSQSLTRKREGASVLESQPL